MNTFPPTFAPDNPTQGKIRNTNYKPNIVTKKTTKFMKCSILHHMKSLLLAAGLMASTSVMAAGNVIGEPIT